MITNVYFTITELGPAQPQIAFVFSFFFILLHFSTKTFVNILYKEVLIVTFLKDFYLLHFLTDFVFISEFCLQLIFK